MKDLWYKLFDLAKEIYILKPWTWMYETDIFGVNIPGKQLNYFISVMGAGEEVFGISAYKGNNALYKFWELQNENPEKSPDKLLLIPHLMLSFEKISEQNFEEVKHFKSIGAPTELGKHCILFHELIPGFVPGIIGDNVANHFVVVLEQSLEVLKRAQVAKYFIHPEGHDDEMYLVRKQKKGMDQLVWQDTYQRVVPRKEKFSVSYSREKYEQLKLLPVKPQVFQCDLIMVPNPVKEGKANPYFPFILLVTDKKKGIVLDFKLLPPLPDLKAMQEKIPGLFIDLLVEKRIKPFKIEICSDILETLLASILGRTGIEVKLVNRLPTVEEAKHSLINHLAG